MPSKLLLDLRNGYNIGKLVSLDYNQKKKDGYLVAILMNKANPEDKVDMIDLSGSAYQAPALDLYYQRDSSTETKQSISCFDSLSITSAVLELSLIHI